MENICGRSVTPVRLVTRAVPVGKINHLVAVDFKLYSPLHSFSSRPMFLLPFTFLFFSCYSVVDAGSANKGEACSQGDNRLQAGTYQFFDDCDSVTYCAANSTCVLKGCRRDDFPFGYAPDAHLPDKCDRGLFCPDEEDQCQPWLAVGEPCQLNRDGTSRQPTDSSLCSCVSQSRRMPSAP